MDSEKEKNRLSDIVLERVGLTGNLLSDPVSPIPGTGDESIGHGRPVGGRESDRPGRIQEEVSGSRSQGLGMEDRIH